jgi:concanavalin A-like lectin/glucanase superfamily protein/purple acid phosphatase-like protein
MKNQACRKETAISNQRLIRPAVLAGLMALLGLQSWEAVWGSTGPAPGGFIEKTNSTSVRPLLTASQINSMLPARGAFLFPAPYNTQGVRLTNGTDCGGADCVNSVGYSYWRNMNNSAGSDTLLAVLSLDRTRGGAGPTLFSYNKLTDEVKVLGPLFDSTSPYSWGNGEGWYFSATLPTALYLPNGSRLLRVDVLSKQMQTVFDVATQYGSDKYIWQVHSSSDDRVHSATLRSLATYEMLGCVAYRSDTARFFYYPKKGDFDECQIDKSGRWLVIKENVDGLYGEDNRVIDLESGTETVLLDQYGAAGHSDNGQGYMVYSDNWNSLPNAIRVFQFGTNQQQAPLVYHNMDWTVPAPNHVSHANAKPGTPLEQQFACGSAANTTNSTRANEIICFRLDTSLDVLVVAPVMTNLAASGGGPDAYTRMPKGNLDPTGQYFIWTSNMGGSRQDAFIVRVPDHLLVSGSSGADSTPPVLSGVSASQVTSSGALVSWTSNETSDSQVDFGTTTAYGASTALDATPVLVHAPALTGLTAGTLYHYRVRSRDAAGNSAVSGDFTFTTSATNVAVPPPSSPIALWKLDEASGTLALDSSGSNLSGTLLDAPLHVPGRVGSALSFDGVNDAVSIPHAAVLDAYPLSVAFWMKTTATGLTALVNKYSAASLSGYQVFTSGGSLCAWYFKDASNYVWDGGGCSLAAAGFNDGKWHHVGFVVDASGGKLFVDGALRASRAWTGTPGATVTTQPVSLARYPGVASPNLAGQLDDVRIYGRALATPEVSALFRAGSEAGPLTWSGGQLTWPADSLYSSYNVYRSTVPLIDANHDGVADAYGSSLASSLTVCTLADAQNPARGSVFFYLLTGSDPGGEGTLGSARNNALADLERLKTDAMASSTSSPRLLTESSQIMAALKLSAR